jgi:hypothetical protein
MPFVRAYITIVAEGSGGKLHEVVAALGDPIAGPSVTGTVYQRSATVAAAGSATMYDTDDLADFNVLVLTASTSGVFVELTADVNGSVGTQRFTLELAANLPLILGSNRSYANYTSPFTGTIDAIEKIVVKNTGTVSSQVQIFAMT